MTETVLVSIGAAETKTLVAGEAGKVVVVLRCTRSSGAGVFALMSGAATFIVPIVSCPQYKPLDLDFPNGNVRTAVGEDLKGLTSGGACDVLVEYEKRVVTT